MSDDKTPPDEPKLWLPASDWAWVPDGKYELGYRDRSYVRYFGKGHKLAITFAILSQGAHFGTLVTRYFNVDKQGRNYRAPRKGDLNREMADLFGKQSARRGMDWPRLKSTIIEGEIRTVTKSTNQRELTEQTRYSVVNRLLRVIQ